MDLLKVVSWNVDGLCDFSPLSNRLELIFSLLLSINPDLILFQEIIPDVIQELDHHLSLYGYFCLSFDNNMTRLPYFCRSYMKITLQSTFLRSSWMRFLSSHMGRGYEMIELNLNNHQLLILNTHLESCKESSEERKNQLKQCFEVLLNHPGPAILLGDLNLRDHEIKSKEQFPELYQHSSLGSHISDCWECLGSPISTRFTWFMPSKPSIRARFDRGYFKQNTSFQKSLVSFDLLGQELILEGILDESSYISDHCGLIVTMQYNSTHSERNENSSQQCSLKRKLIDLTSDT